MRRTSGVRWAQLDPDSQEAITMRLTQIRDFLAVVECAGIRPAARKLGVSQPTVTKSIRGLEAELQVQLLGRSTRGIALTPAGRAFFARARVAQSELRKAGEEAAQSGGSSTGSVAFGVGNVGAALIVPEAVARFRQQFPRARLRVVEGLAHLLLPSVRDETLDFVMGLRPVTPLDPALRFRPLYRSDLVVAARKGHPLRHARALSDLAAADWISTATLGLPGGPVERLFEAGGLPPPRPMIQCESFNTVVALLTRTDMLGLMQRRTLKEPFARDLLQEIPIADPIPSVTAGLFTRADTPLTRVAAAMVRNVTAVARTLVRPV
jgi:LysR family transcriptional regulator, regulator of abg operon